MDLAYAGREAWTRDRADLAAGTWREIADLSGVENLVGTAHNDLLAGDGGANTLAGGAGADSFVFGNAWGRDLITDFQDGSDRIDLTAVTGLDSFAQLSIVDVAGGAEVSFGGNSIVLTSITMQQLTSQDFLI